MPAPGKRWRHIIINTRCSWLHGDEKGFRDRDHRIHSSGDYKSPPPEGEHQRLHEFYEERSGDAIEIPTEAREVIGRAIMQNLTERGHLLLVISVSKFHAHFVVELPDSVKALKTIVGWAKQKSSRAVTELLPGEVWSAGETYKPIDSQEHLQAATRYVWDQRTQGAWVWSRIVFREEGPAVPVPRQEPERDPGAQPPA